MCLKILRNAPKFWWINLFINLFIKFKSDFDASKIDNLLVGHQHNLWYIFVCSELIEEPVSATFGMWGSFGAGSDKFKYGTKIHTHDEIMTKCHKQPSKVVARVRLIVKRRASEADSLYTILLKCCIWK